MDDFLIIYPAFGTWYALHMRVGWSQHETLKTLRVPQHLAPLPSQGGAWRGACLLSRHTHLEHLFSFLPRGNTAQGREAKCQAMGIRRLAHPVARGHAEQRCDGIGADRHADVIQPESRGGCQLEVKRGAQLLTQRGRGHGCNQRLALGSGVVREPLHLKNLLARKQAEDIGSPPRDEGFAGRSLLQTAPQRGSG